ncbi:metalloendopeptidase [Coemansia sp. RSA 638]|nr:metalloendopeptidase [Coemansia sp. RSA 638]
MYNLNESKYSINRFLQHVSPEKQVRDASAESETLEESFKAETLLRRDVYKTIRAVYDNEEEMDSLSDENRRLVEKMELEYRREGAALSEDKFNELTKLKLKLEELEVTFQRNIDSRDEKTMFTRGELDGLPNSYFKDRETKDIVGGTKYVVSTCSADYFLLMNHAQLEATRRAMFLVQNNRCTDNVQVLNEAIKIRQEKAILLGYETHAEYALEPLMAKTPQAAYDMLADLRKNLTELGSKELEELEQLKRTDMQAVGKIYEGFFEWDRSFYANKLSKQKRSINYNELRCYLSLPQVIRGMFELYQSLFGVKIVEMENPSVWHDDVEMYELWEADKTFIGHFYTDFFHRSGKSPHISVHSIRSGYEDDTRQFPVSAIVASFAKPESNAPVLLHHNEVEMLMGELGRVFQNMLCKSKLAIFNGCKALEQDFVQTPIRILKDYMWSHVLNKIACHYKTGEPIPHDLVTQLQAVKTNGAGLSYLRQVFLAMYDLRIYNSAETVDANSLFNSMNTDISLISCGGTRTFVVAKLGYFIKHSLASKYYAHLWSQVNSADILESCFLKDGIDTSEVGLAFRSIVLEAGGSKDSLDGLTMFLGREPNTRAFLSSIGVNSKSFE